MVFLSATQVAEQGLKPTDLLDGTLPPLSHTIAQHCLQRGAEVLVVCGQLSLHNGARPRPCYWDVNFTRCTKGKNHRGAEVCFPGSGEIYVVAPHLVVLHEHKPGDPQAFFILAPNVEVHSDYVPQEADPKSKSHTLEPEGIETLVKKAWEGEDISAHLVSLTAVSLLALARRLGLPISGKGKRRQDYLDTLTKTLEKANLSERFFSPEPEFTYTPVQLPGMLMFMFAFMCLC